MIRLLVIISMTFLVGVLSANDSLMTIKEYQTKIYEILNLDTTGTEALDSAMVVGFARDAIHKASTDIGIPKGRMIELTADQYGYLIDNGLTWIRGIVLDTNNTFYALRPIDPLRLTELTYYNNLTGEFERPCYYVRHGDSVRVYPSPNTTDSMYVYYFVRDNYPKIDDRPDTVNVLVPSEYRLAIIYAGAQLCMIRKSEYERADYFGKKYMEEVVTIRRKFEVEGHETIQK